MKCPRCSSPHRLSYRMEAKTSLSRSRRPTTLLSGLGKLGAFGRIRTYSPEGTDLQSAATLQLSRERIFCDEVGNRTLVFSWMGASLPLTYPDNLAEVVRFELTDRFDSIAAFPRRCLRPLGHTSISKTAERIPSFSEDREWARVTLQRRILNDQTNKLIRTNTTIQWPLIWSG